jgi:hypothetical protein
MLTVTKNGQIKFTTFQLLVCVGGVIAFLILVIISMSIISGIQKAALHNEILELKLQIEGLKKDIEYKDKELKKIENVKKIMFSFKCNDPVVLKALVKTWDPEIIAKVIAIESQFTKKAVSKVGAIGFMQVMPFHFKGVKDPYDTEINIARGSELLLSWFVRYGNLRDALVAYNGGDLAAITGRLKPETIEYVKKYQKLENQFPSV